MNRKELKQIAESTLYILNQKKYFINSETIYLNSDNFYKIYNESPAIIHTKKFCEKPVIEVKNESVISTIHRMGDGVGVLNFASAKHPCGGFLNGSLAQEECLAYCSDLYIQQWPNAQEYYLKHRNNPNPYYSDTMFINGVTFFRDENYNLIKDYTVCKVLSSAAVNVSAIKKQGDCTKNVQFVMKCRMRKILDAFIDCKCKNIILGAFGCGVFGNSPEDVARIWKELLINEEYQYCFEKICFSVLDSARSNNFDVFRKIFSE